MRVFTCPWDRRTVYQEIYGISTQPSPDFVLSSSRASLWTGISFRISCGFVAKLLESLPAETFISKLEFAKNFIVVMIKLLQELLGEDGGLESS